ncbi:MAG TPA: tRNA (adenosine(37)-N6)-threonylcarbamoyltransferase complex dimerization subunit type 1 TsaB [Acidobacteriota bacterium]|nr:tRNA (adenosine(37)-N6)-threonylcarbamoyltransferase complex dimerization subunit type 1 TsaB [Acidobacteriota bacterium]
MYLLSLDTATNSGGVALSRNAEVVSVWMCKTPMRYSERVIPWIENVLDAHGLRPHQLDALAVALGPGSFTGIRIGMATAKALAQSLEKPLVGISTLEALAYRYRWSDRLIVPWIDARRQQVFGAAYRIPGLDTEEVLPPSVDAPARWLKKLPEERCLLVGDGAEFYRSTIEAERPGDQVLAGDNQIVESLCQLGYFRYTRGRTSAPESLQALYVRPSDAEIGQTPQGARP